MGCGGRGRACEWQERPAGRKTGQRRPRGCSSVGPANLPAMRVLPLRETLALLAGLNEESLTAPSQAGRRFNRGREDLACDTRRMTLCRRPRCRRRLDASVKSTAPPFDTPRTGRRPPLSAPASPALAITFPTPSFRRRSEICSCRHRPKLPAPRNQKYSLDPRQKTRMTVPCARRKLRPGGQS